MKTIRRPRPQFNLRKAADYAIVINALQIAAMAALAVYVLNDEVNAALSGVLGDVLVIVMFLVVAWGAAVDIREALAARRMTVKLSGLNETVNQMTDLNHALRAQRHDFLNHLQVVYSLIEMGEYQEANRYIDQVYGSIQALSKTLKTACAPVNALLRAKTAEAAERGIYTEVRVQGTWEGLPLPAWEMCRVLSNLMDNAMDALAEVKKPRLVLTLGEDVKRFFFEVWNNGPAIPAEKQADIFEPGYSGKGEGRGMGLYIARETLRGVGGDLTVQSDAQATVFSGDVPRTARAAEERET